MHFGKKHEQQPRPLTPAEYLEKVKEGAAAAAGQSYDPSKLHCGGCIYGCPLNTPKCDFGKGLAKVLQEQTTGAQKA